MKTKIDDCRAYWNEIVDADYKDFLDQPDDLRKAFHCAISLFHMADWMFKEKSLAYWQTSGMRFQNRAGVMLPVSDEKSFASAVTFQNRDFELIRNIANSIKHFSLSRPGNHPHSPSHAANTYAQPPAFAPGVFASDAFATTGVIMLEGPNGHDLRFADLASSVRTTIEDLCKQHGIHL